MSEAKFTKGEWNVQFGDMIFSSDGINNEQVAVVCNEDNSDKYLIALAPEMYEEIERDIGWLGMMKAKFVLGSYEYQSICLRIESKQKLLAKARGEQK